MPIKAKPDGQRTVTPYLIIEGVPTVIDFMKEAFGAEEVHRSTLPDGSVMHAQVRIGDSNVMLGEASAKWQPMPGSIHLYLDDTDKAYRKALAAGASSVMPPADQFYGDRSAGVKDPAGNVWWIATHKEDVAPEEIERRMQAAVKERQAQGA